MMNVALDIKDLDLNTLRNWYHDACDSAAAALPGTDLHKVRVAHVAKLATELGHRGATLRQVP